MTRLAGLALHKAHHGPAGAELLDEAVYGRLTDFEFGPKQCHFGHRHLASAVFQELSNCVCASARFIPKRLVNFVGGWLTHSKTPSIVSIV
jgi:hypothetical protein